MNIHEYYSKTYSEFKIIGSVAVKGKIRINLNHVMAYWADESGIDVQGVSAGTMRFSFSTPEEVIAAITKIDCFFAKADFFCGDRGAK